MRRNKRNFIYKRFRVNRREYGSYGIYVVEGSRFQFLPIFTEIAQFKNPVLATRFLEVLQFAAEYDTFIKAVRSHAVIF